MKIKIVPEESLATIERILRPQVARSTSEAQKLSDQALLRHFQCYESHLAVLVRKGK